MNLRYNRYMIKRKVGLVVFVVGTLASSLVLIDQILMGVTPIQGIIASVIWVSTVFLFIVGFEIMTSRR